MNQISAVQSLAAEAVPEQGLEKLMRMRQQLERRVQPCGPLALALVLMAELAPARVLELLAHAQPAAVLAQAFLP